MTRRRDPNASVAWLRPPAGADGLAGAAFLVGPELAVTCAHVVRAHLGLGTTTPAERPKRPLTLRFAALGRDVAASVAECGWFPEARGDRPSDIAVLRLDQPVDDVPAAGPAINPPVTPTSCYTFGCPGEGAIAYLDYGQEVNLTFNPHLDLQHLHQLLPEDGRKGGYVVRPGFSGAPVFDLSGNYVLAMIARWDKVHCVAFAVPAEKLSEALEEVKKCARKTCGPTPEVYMRESSPVDPDAYAAMAASLPKLDAILEASGVDEPSIADLRDAFRSLAELGRQPEQTEAVRDVLQAVGRGDTKPAERILLDGPTSSEDAYRQAGALALLRNPDESFITYRVADALSILSPIEDQFGKIVQLTSKNFEIVRKSFEVIGIPIVSSLEAASWLISQRIRKNIQDYIHDQAYFIWESSGKPFGLDMKFWHDAEKQFWGPLYPLKALTRQLAEKLWEQAGRQQGRNLDFWLAAEEAVLRELEAAFRQFHREETKSPPHGDNRAEDRVAGTDSSENATRCR